MSLFGQGEYLKAAEEETMAETIAKVLYPDDNHIEGKSLRLRPGRCGSCRPRRGW